jgi:RNA polymerase sigma-70 factor (ECF subfamily)
MTDRADRDIELIGEYLKGDIDSFNELVAAHEDRVFGICLRMLPNREAALDATQDTFLTVFRKVDRYKAQAAFSTWLYRVTMNTCYDHLRREKRKRADRLPDSYDPVDVRAGDPFTAVDVRQDIEDALLELSVEFRSAVILVDLQGLSLQQASDTLEVPTGTVKSRLFRARRHLAKSLGNLKPPSEHPNNDTGES